MQGTQSYLNLVKQLYEAQAALLGISVNAPVLHNFVEEMEKLEPPRVLQALKMCMVKNIMPSVAEVHKMCGIKVDYLADGEVRRPAPKTKKARNEEKKKELETVVFRFEAPAPLNTQMEESQNYWRAQLQEKRFEGYALEFWNEYEGIHEEEVVNGKRVETHKQRIFFASALMTKKENAKLISSKNHFGEKPVTEESDD